MSEESSALLLFPLFLLAGCLLNTYVGAFLFDYAGSAASYRNLQFHRTWPLRWILGQSAVGVMDRRSILFPFIEIGTACALLHYSCEYGLVSLSTAKYTAGGLLMLLLCLINVRTKLFPDHFTDAIFVCGAFFLVTEGIQNHIAVPEKIAGFFVGALLVYIVRRVGSSILRREAMGLGDVILAANLGLLLGWPDILGWFFLSPFFGLCHGMWRLPVTGQSTIPTGPMWLFGYLAATNGHIQREIDFVVSRVGDVQVFIVLLICLALMSVLLLLWKLLEHWLGKPKKDEEYYELSWKELFIVLVGPLGHLRFVDDMLADYEYEEDEDEDDSGAERL